MAHRAQAADPGGSPIPISDSAGIWMRLTAWWAANRTALVQAGAVFLSVRIALWLVAVLAGAHLPEQQGLHDVFHRSHNVWLDVWARWDSEYYLDIAKYGYWKRTETYPFFPFYPVLLSTVAPLFRHDYVLSGIVVSSVAYLVALVYLFKLVAWEWNDDLAGRTILYTAVYPMALFFLAVYTESLFLAVTVICFYYARRGQWRYAGIAGFLAGLTRGNGIVLVLPLAYEVWSQGGALHGLRSLLSWRTVGRLTAASMPAVAVVLYIVYIGWLAHDPLAYIHRESQIPWTRMPSLPWNTLLGAIQHLQRPDLTTLSRAVNNTDLVIAVLLIEASVLAWWRLPRAYAIYLGAYTLMLLSTTQPDWPLQSLPRYASVLFPAFILLAQLGENRNWDRAIIIMSAPFLGLFTGLFATWYWIF